MAFQQIIDNASVSPKKLFLLDGLGALLSAFLLGVILTTFESTFGMPRKTLFFLAFLPCVFAAYDFFCYARITENWKPFLKGIAMANFAYCCISLGLLIYHYSMLTPLGVLYFVLELVLVLGLAYFELKVASKT